MHPLLRKLLSPVGFLFVALCFLLPFAAASCQSPQFGSNSASYTGADLVSRGRPEVHLSDQVRQQYPNVPPGYADDQIRQETSPVPVQALLVGALGAAVAGIVVAALRRPWSRALAATGTGLITAILLVGGEVIAVHAVRRQVSPMAAELLGSDAYSVRGFGVHPRYGFWLALLLSVALAVFNGVTLLRLSRSTIGQPEQESAVSRSG